jgi:hypothetical protein
MFGKSTHLKLDRCLESRKLMLCSVPISQLPRFVRETTIDFEERGIVACHLG